MKVRSTVGRACHTGSAARTHAVYGVVCIDRLLLSDCRGPCSRYAKEWAAYFEQQKAAEKAAGKAAEAAPAVQPALLGAVTVVTAAPHTQQAAVPAKPAQAAAPAQPAQAAAAAQPVHTPDT